MLRDRFWSLVMPVVVGILVMVLVSFMALHLQQEGQGKAVLEDTELKSRLVEAFEAGEDEYKVDLSQAENLAKSTRSIFPSELDERVLYESILNLAKSFNVSVVIDPGGDPAKERIEGIEYRIKTISITVQGRYQDVVAFVVDLDSEQVLLGSLLLESLTIRATGDEEATANLNCEFYTLA